MEHVLRDCPRCRSAGSVSKGICQVCLSETQSADPLPVRLGTTLALGILRSEPVERRLMRVS